MTPGDPLSRALASAVGGKPQPLQDLLLRGSRLPGTHMNAELAEAFAQACRGAGEAGDRVALGFLKIPPDHAPGATALEFLPVCGLGALSARAAADARLRGRVLPELHGLADDPRFRVRDAVVAGLARIGASAGDALVAEVEGWMDGYFHAAAVVTALGREEWLSALRDAEPVLARLDQALALVMDAPRAAARYPGHKALVEALGTAPPALANRFGVPLFDLLVRWAETTHPVQRAIVDRAIAPRSLSGRFGPDVDRVRAVLHTSKAPARNPDHDHGPSRDRSGNRRKGRR